MNSIDVSHLNFAYNGSFVLEDISFSIEQGKFVGIFGPNGGGKTTLLSLLAGFLKPDSGRVLLFGKPPQQIRNKIAFVPQTFRFDRHFPISVEEVVLGGRLSQLSWWGRFAKKEYSAVTEALDKMGMRSFLKEPFANLSGGQTQRVLIARALASSPSILFLDEPTASVDYTAQTAIYQLLSELKGNMTIVMVTHDLRGAVDAVDQLFCVQKTLTPMTPEKVCEHFAVGLYHTPLITHVKQKNSL